jgi:hypothetical protein
MRNRLFLVSLIVMCLAFTLAAKGDDHHDGNWWNSLPRTQKLAYTAGFLDGQTYAHSMLSFAVLNAMVDPKTKKIDPGRIATAKDVEGNADDQNKRDFEHVTVGQLVAGLDKVYADYRNLRIDVFDAMVPVVRGIGGMPDDEIEKLLQNKRKAAAE